MLKEEVVKVSSACQVVIEFCVKQFVYCGVKSFSLNEKNYCLKILECLCSAGLYSLKKYLNKFIIISYFLLPKEFAKVSKYFIS